MFCKLYTKQCGWAFLLFLILFISSCQKQSIDFRLTPTERTEYQEFITVQVDNCDGIFAKSHTYRYPYIGKTVGVENLRPNGGEPFRTITKQIWAMYGEQAEKLHLTVPTSTRREFTFVVTKIEYRGVVSGQIIEENKVVQQQDAVFFYPFTQSILVDSYQDMPCQ